MNRLMCVGEAMRFALNSVAIGASEWLLATSDPEWLDRYGHRIEESHLPQSQEDRLAVAELIGRDGSKVLTDLSEASAPPFLRAHPGGRDPTPHLDPKRRLGRGTAPVAKQRQSSTREPGESTHPLIQKLVLAKSARRGGPVTSVHLTETCEEDAPHLITHVPTTAATTTDEAMTETIHADAAADEAHPTSTLARFRLYHSTHSGQQEASGRD